MNMNYYFDPKRKEIICRYCGSGYREYQSLFDHMREKHYQKITPEPVIE